MAKVVVYALLTITFIVLIFLAPKKQNQTESIEGLISRRIGRRLEMPVFDPLVTRIERLSHEKEADTKAVETGKDKEDDMFEEYFAQERRLNTTMRIKFLFPLLDASPRDGFVSLKELQTWMMQQTEDNMGYRTAKELELQDKDKDGVLTFEEYLPQFSKQDIGNHLYNMHLILSRSFFLIMHRTMIKWKQRKTRRVTVKLVGGWNNSRILILIIMALSTLKSLTSN